MKDYNEYLNTTVLQENRPVTYKSLARSLKIHVDTAKQALYKFSTENTANVHAVYCISGKTIKNNQFTIQLVKENELEDVKKAYKQITGVHVYSVTSFDPIEFSVLYSACKDIPKLSIKERYECGILENTNATMVKLEASRSVASRKHEPYIAKPTVPKATPAKTTNTKATTTKATANKPTISKKGTLSFAAVKKNDGKKPADKNETKEPTEKKVTTGIKRKVDHEELEKKMAKATIKPEDIFSSDEDEPEEKEPEAEEPLPMEVDDEIMDEAEEIKDTTNDESLASPEEVAPPPPGKAKRKVLKKKTTMNSRGLMVTEEVWEWETVDASEVEESKPAPKKPSAPTKAAPKKAGSTAKKPPSAQTNLFSFFNKK